MSHVNMKYIIKFDILKKQPQQYSEKYLLVVRLKMTTFSNFLLFNYYHDVKL